MEEAGRGCLCAAFVTLCTHVCISLSHAILLSVSPSLPGLAAVEDAGLCCLPSAFHRPADSRHQKQSISLNVFSLQGVLLWKKQGEVALQRSGIDYTIVRPGETFSTFLRRGLGSRCANVHYTSVRPGEWPIACCGGGCKAGVQSQRACLLLPRLHTSPARLHLVWSSLAPAH